MISATAARHGMPHARQHAIYANGEQSEADGRGEVGGGEGSDRPLHRYERLPGFFIHAGLVFTILSLPCAAASSVLCRVAQSRCRCGQGVSPVPV